MANTLGTKERMILTSALEAYHTILAPFQAFSMNVMDEETGSTAGKQGETVLVKIASSRTASNFNATYETSGDQTFTDKTVTLNQRQHVSFHMTDLESTQHKFNHIEAAAMEASEALAKAIFQNVTLVFVDGGSYSNTTVTVANMDADDIIDLRKLQNDDGVPLSNRSILCTPAVAANLLKDNALQDASASGSTAPLREGAIGRLGGYTIYETSSLSTTVTAGTSNVHTIAVHPTALAAAIRTIPPSDAQLAASAGLRYGEMTHPATGVTLGMRTWYNTATGTRWGTFEALWGKTVAQANGAELLKFS